MNILRNACFILINVFIYSTLISSCTLNLVDSNSTSQKDTLNPVDPNFASPEDTLASYINALIEGNVKSVCKCLYLEGEDCDFYLPGPSPIESYKIINKILFGETEVNSRNEKGFKPPAKIGDIQFDVV